MERFFFLNGYKILLPSLLLSLLLPCELDLITAMLFDFLRD